MSKRHVSFVNYSHLRNLLKGIGNKCENWEQILLKETTELRDKSKDSKNSAHCPHTQEKITNDHSFLPCDDSFLLVKGRNSHISKRSEPRTPKLDGLGLNDSSFMWTSAMATQKEVLESGSKPGVDTTLVHSSHNEMETSALDSPPKSNNTSLAVSTAVVGEMTPEKPATDALSVFFASPIANPGAKSLKKPPKKKAHKRKIYTEHELEDIAYYIPDNNNRFEGETLIGNQTSEVNDSSTPAQSTVDEDTFIHKLNNSALPVNPARIKNEEQFLSDNPESDAVNGSENSFCFNPTLALSPLSRGIKTSTPLRPPNKRAKMCFPNENQADEQTHLKLQELEKNLSSNSTNVLKSEKSLCESVDDVDMTFAPNVKSRPIKFSYPNKAQIEHFMTENAVPPKSDLIDISMEPVKEWPAEDKMKLKKYANLTSKVDRSHATSAYKKMSNNSGWQGVQNKEAAFEERASTSTFFDPTFPSAHGPRVDVEKSATNMVCANSEVSNRSSSVKSAEACPEPLRGCDYGVNSSITNNTVNCGSKSAFTPARSKRFASDVDPLNLADSIQKLNENSKNIEDKGTLAVAAQLLPQSNVVSFQSANGVIIQPTAVSRDRVKSLFKDILKGAGDMPENNHPVVSIHNNSMVDLTHSSHLETEGESSLVDPNGIIAPDQLEVNKSVVTLSQSFIWREIKKNADKEVVIESKQLKFDVLWSATKCADSVQYFCGEGQMQTVISMEPLKNLQVNGSPCRLVEPLSTTNQELSLPNVAAVPSIEFGQEVGDVSRSNMNLGECGNTSGITSALSVKNMNVECRRNMASDKTFQKSTEKVHNENSVHLDDPDNKENILYKGAYPDKSETRLSSVTSNLNQEVSSEVGFSSLVCGGKTYSSTTAKTGETNSPAFAGFRTARGDEVSVNPKFLEKAKSLLSDVTVTEHESYAVEDSDLAPGTSDNRHSNQDEASFPCFYARGELSDTKQIALSKVQSPSDDFAQTKPFEQSCLASHSTNNKVNASHSVGHDKEEQNNSLQFPTPFLSSGSGKIVSVSKESFANAIKCIQACEDNKSMQKQDGFQIPGEGAPLFSTANGNPVTVSNESFLNAKNILQTCESDELNDGNKTSFSNTNVCSDKKFEGHVFGFSTGHGKEVTVSRKSFEKVQKMFTGNFESNEKSSLGLEEMTNDKMDIQVEFNVANKFEVPYKKTALNTEIPFTTNEADKNHIRDLGRNILADERKKQAAIIRTKLKNKTSHPILGSLSSLRANSTVRVSLNEAVGHKTPSSHIIDDLLDNGVLPATLNVCSPNAEDHKFYASDMTERKNLKTFLTTDGGIVIPDESGEIGKKEFHRALLAAPGVSPASVDERWTYNHYKWIVWKLASMEKAFPVEFGGRCLTIDVVFSQLKFRYDTEMTLGRRSALKRIFERDDTPKRSMVLCVASVKKSEKDGHFTLLLTDGWYSIPAVLDELLNSMVAVGKIRVGVKLCIFGSELSGSDEACSPLDAVETTSLKLHGNSTRRARWNSKLGFIYGQVPKFALSSLKGTGGNVVCMDVFVTRVYPLLYYEKYPGGGRGVIRNSRLEKKFADDFESRKQTYAEKFYEKCEKEYQARLRKDGKGFHQDSENGDSQDNKASNEKDESLSDFIKRKVEKEKNLFPNRNVIPLLKIKVAGCHPRDTAIRSVAILTIWNATEDVMSLTGEGSRLLVYNVVASSERSDDILTLNASRSTRYQRMVVEEDNFVKQVYQPRFASRLSDVTTGNDEYDIVALIVKISDKKVFNHFLTGFFETALIADEEGRIGAILFQGGLAALGVEGIIKQGALVACSNLRVFKNNHHQKTGLNSSFSNNVSSLVTFKTFELSEFSSRPLHKHLSAVIGSFNSLLSSDKYFLTSAQKAVEEILKGHENKSSTLIRTPNRSAGKRLDEFDRNVTSVLQLNTSDSAAFAKSLEEEDRVFSKSFSSDIRPLTPKARPSGLRKNLSLPVSKEEPKSSEPNKDPDFDFNGFSEEWICD